MANILLIHNYYKIRGGEDVVFEQEAEALEKRGHKVIKYTRHNEEIDQYGFWEKISFFWRAISNQRTKRELEALLEKHKIEIAHVHNVFPLISPIIYKILHKHKIKVVQTLHNYRFLCPNGLFYRNKQICQRCSKGDFWSCVIHKCYKDSFIFSLLYAFIIKLNQKNFKKNIDGYIALTQFAKNIFIDNGFKEKKVYVKDNGFFDPKKSQKASEGYFLYLGRISEEKGLDFLLASFAKMPEYKLKVAGAGFDLACYKEKYQNFVNIKFMGRVEGEKKDVLIQKTEALLMPSVCFENYPLAIGEAFSFGVPVIASKIGSIPFIVEEGQSGFLFEVNNFADFAAKLKKIYGQKALRKKMGQQARKVFEERMDFEINIKRLEEIYRRVLNVEI